MAKGPKGLDGIVECPDGHRCENGSLCIENPYDEGNFYCDCDTAFGNSAYKGLYCEHEATEYCSYNGAVSRTSFCTNRGRCIANVGEDESHLGCDCPEDYEGDHCQFVKGTKPSVWPYTKEEASSPTVSIESRSSGGGLSGGAILGIVALLGLLLPAMVLVSVFLVRRFLHLERDNRHTDEAVGSSSPSKGPVTEQDLDPDGGTLPINSDSMEDLDTGVEDVMSNEGMNDII